METNQKSAPTQLVPASVQGLAVRSAALVARGLRDLARDSNWLIKKVFTGRSPHLSVSPSGQVCAISQHVRHGTQRAALYDIERSVPTMALSVPGEPDGCPQSAPAVFAWSPTGRYLVTAWGAWKSELHMFDLHGKMFLGSFGNFRTFPACLAWSDTGKYFAAAAPGGKSASLRLWQADANGIFTGHPTGELGLPERIEPQEAGDEFAEEGSFRGYGRTAFSPDEKLLASVVEIKGDWADDSILLLETPALGNQSTFDAQGHITDITWTPGGRGIIYCAAGQAYHLPIDTMDFQPLPFGAELCACHPHLPLCLCFSSWLKNSAKGRLFLADLNRQAVFDEYPAEGVVDLRWSLDGSRAYAATSDGLAYIYEPPLI